MRHYELNYLIPVEFSEEEKKTLSEKIISVIKENGGILEESRQPIQQNLAHPIKKKGSAFLVTLDFQTNPEKVVEIEKKIKSESVILRYFIATKKIIKPGLKIPRRPPKQIIPLEEKLPLISQGKKREKKVELQEIDKKLKEILGE